MQIGQQSRTSSVASYSLVIKGLSFKKEDSKMFFLVKANEESSWEGVFPSQLSTKQLTILASSKLLHKVFLPLSLLIT